MKTPNIAGLADILTLPVQERVTLARCAAFFDGLRLINDEERRLNKKANFSATRRAAAGKEKGMGPIECLQELTLARSNVYAQAFDVSFPDETEREEMNFQTLDALEANEKRADEEIFETEANDLDVREVFEETDPQ